MKVEVPELSQPVKAYAVRPGNLSSIPWYHMIEDENGPPQLVLWLLQPCQCIWIYVHIYTLTDTPPPMHTNIHTHITYTKTALKDNTRRPSCCGQTIICVKIFESQEKPSCRVVSKASLRAEIYDRTWILLNLLALVTSMMFEFRPERQGVIPTSTPPPLACLK